jgi:uncharacterized delta-60 repeat protein
MMRPLLLSAWAALAFSGNAVAQPGELDPAFGGDGIVILHPGDLHDVATDAIALPDNTLLICGNTRLEGVPSAFVAHLLEDGSIDVDFGESAGFTFLGAGEETYVFGIALDTQGRIVVCGLAYPTLERSVVLVARMQGNGLIDTGFGDNGYVLKDVGSGDAEARGLVTLDDNSICIGGSAVNQDFTRDCLFMAFNEDGSLREGFGVGGIATADAHPAEDLLMSICRLDDGSLVGAGYGDVDGLMQTVLAKVDDTGAFDSAFGVHGILFPAIGPSVHAAYAIASNGSKFFVAGTSKVDGRMNAYAAKFRSSGESSFEFGSAGVSLVAPTPYQVFLDVTQQPHGKLVLCGTAGQEGFGVPRDFLVVRLSDSGAADPDFGTDGIVLTDVQVDFDDANAVAVQPDGKIVAAGFTSGFSAGTDNDIAVARYLIDGTLAASVRQSEALSCYPNPMAQGILTITGLPTGTAQVDVFDATGRALLRRANMATSGTLRLDLDGAAAGSYQVAVRVDGRLFQGHVLVLQ